MSERLRYVLLAKFCADAGYTVKAVEDWIANGQWKRGRHYVVAPDGDILFETAMGRERLYERPSPAKRTMRAKPSPPSSAEITCGVYMLRTAHEVVYVGRSTNLRARLRTHRHSGRPFDGVQIIPCDADAAVWLEKELIRTLQPAQNQVRYQRHTLTQAKLVGAFS